MNDSYVQPPHATGSVIMLSLCTLAAVAGVGVSMSVLGHIDRMEAGAGVTMEQWLSVLAVFGLHALIAAGLYLLTGLVFTLWMYRAVKYARSVAPQANSTAPGWVWLIILPVVGHILPPMMAQAAYSSCRKLERKNASGGSAVLVWGALWLAMWVTYVVTQFTGQPDPFVEGATAESVRAFWHMHLAYQVVTGLTAIAGAVMVAKVSGVQGRLATGSFAAEPEELPPALLRSGLPGMDGGAADPEPPLIAPRPAVTTGPAAPAPQPAPSGLAGGLPGMPPPPPPANEEEAVRRAGLPRPTAASDDEEPRQFMPGIPPPPEQSEAA